MRALVVYESHFGNTMDVAHAVLAGLRQSLHAEILEVTSAPSELVSDFDLLVLGAPTHALGLSRPESRRDAAKQGAKSDVDKPGMREWLDRLQRVPAGCAVAAFGTTAAKPRFLASLGTAAGALERRLRRMDAATILPAQQFWVEGVAGPLLGGEEARAAAWGASLAQALLEAAGDRAAATPGAATQVTRA